MNEANTINIIRQKYNEFVSNTLNKNSVNRIKELLKNYTEKGTTVFKKNKKDYLPVIFVGHKINGYFKFENILKFYPLIHLISCWIEIDGTKNQEFKFIINNIISITMDNNMMANAALFDVKINYDKLIRLLLHHMTDEKIEKLEDDKLLTFFVLFDDLYNLIEKEFFFAALDISPDTKNNNNDNNNNNNNNSNDNYRFLKI